MHGIVRLVRARVLLVSIVAMAAGCRTPEHPASAASPPMHSTAAAERAIRQIIQDETRAWNEGDAVAYSRHFATDGIFTNIRGQAFDGYDAFLRQHEVVFRGFFLNTRLQQDVVVLRFVVVRGMTC